MTGRGPALSARGLVLSTFPGSGLLDLAFELEGYTVVRGPDALWGGDIRAFRPPAGVFDGIIGGPPCQRFSSLANMVRQRWGEAALAPDLIPEFERCVAAARPAWFLMENVPRAPVPRVPGYVVRDTVLDNRWVDGDGDGIGEVQRRRRRFSFGTPTGVPLAVAVAAMESPAFEYAVVSSGGGFRRGAPGQRRSDRTRERCQRSAQRTVADLCILQGLPGDFLDRAPFTSEAKRQVIANGVPLPMGRAVARAIALATGSPPAAERCGATARRDIGPSHSEQPRPESATSSPRETAR